jgi:hypothetical protein
MKNTIKNITRHKKASILTLIVLKCVMSRTVALAFYNNLPVIPLYYTYATLTSSPEFTSLYLNN